MGLEVTLTVGVVPVRNEEPLPALPLLEAPHIKRSGMDGYLLERLDIEGVGMEDVRVWDMDTLVLVLGRAGDDLLPMGVSALVALIVIEASEGRVAFRTMAHPHFAKDESGPSNQMERTHSVRADADT